MQVRVYVTLKPGVLDPAGKAVQGGLSSLGYDEVRDVRIGRFFEIEIAEDGADGEGRSRDEIRASVEARVKDMCRTLLANTVIERFRVEVPE